MSFFEKLQGKVDHGLKNSKELFGRAKDKAKDLGEIGVLKFEIKQLESQAEQLSTKLGSKVYETLIVKGIDSINLETEGIQAILSAIEGVKDDIETKEELLKKFD